MKRGGPLSRKTPMPAGKPLRKTSEKCKTAGPKPMKQTSHRSPLTDNARGQDCQLRLPGCRNDQAYTVFCHIRRNGWGGMGSKPADVLGYFGCDQCHAKEGSHHPDCTDADLLRAMGNTLLIQLRDGLIVTP